MHSKWGLCGPDLMVVGFTTICAYIITKVVKNSKPVPGEVYTIQHYMMKFVSDLRQVGGFLRFPPPTKLRSI